MDGLRPLRRLGLLRGHAARHPWALVIALTTFAVVVAVLLGMGLHVGVGLAELIPTALIQGTVFAGLLFISAMAQDEPVDGRGRPRRQDPASEPPPSDPSVWLALLAELDAEHAQTEKAAAPPLSGHPSR